VEEKLPPELQPEHDILGANPAIHSSLIENIKVGRITPHRASAGEITATGLSLTNGETIDNLDAIILCTGYDIDYPFISDDCYRSKHSKSMDSPNSVHLYRLTVPPQVRSLFIMGIFQLPGLIQPAVELQARWVTAILTGGIKLPPAERMSLHLESNPCDCPSPRGVFRDVLECAISALREWEQASTGKGNHFQACERWKGSK
jgi:dimethylaniline monooxygenase (N-oxide forming)